MVKKRVERLLTPQKTTENAKEHSINIMARSVGNPNIYS